MSGWRAVAQLLQQEGDYRLAEGVRLFVARMAPPKTDQEQLVDRVNALNRTRQHEPIERTR
jgi:hypothetical protein